MSKGEQMLQWLENKKWQIINPAWQYRYDTIKGGENTKQDIDRLLAELSVNRWELVSQTCETLGRKQYTFVSKRRVR